MNKNASYAVVFDFGGVLVDWNPRYLYHTHFTSTEEMERFLESPFKKINQKMDEGHTWESAIKETGLVEYTELFKIYVTQYAQSFHGTIKESEVVLRKLHQQKIPLYGLTNWSADNFPWAKSTFDFMNLFEGIVVSGMEKMIKPDPRIYRLLTDRFQLQPEKTIFIDDKYENVLAAQQLGWVGVHFTSPEKLKHDLLEYFAFL